MGSGDVLHAVLAHAHLTARFKLLNHPYHVDITFKHRTRRIFLPSFGSLVREAGASSLALTLAVERIGEISSEQSWCGEQSRNYSKQGTEEPYFRV